MPPRRITADKKKEVHVFLDTNVFIHCVPVTDMDLSCLFHAQSLTIVIPPILFNELDRIKDKPESQRLRKRARDATKFIELAQSNRQQNNNVSVAVLKTS